MHVLVTGASGFIGKALTAALLQAGHTVQPVDRSSGIDLLDWAALEGTIVRKPDAIVHLAARSFVPDSYENPRAFYETNVLGTTNALELARRSGARFVFLSSYVYGTPSYLPIDEGHPLAAINPYAETKLMGEQLCAAYARHHGVATTVLRPFNVYGPGQDERFLIPSIIRQSETGRVALKDPRPRRDFVYVDDVVRAIMAATEAHRPAGGDALPIVNIGSGRSHSLQEVLQLIQKNAPRPFEVHFSGETRPNEVLDTVSDIRKAAALLDWKPQVSLEQGLQKMLLAHA